MLSTVVINPDYGGEGMTNLDPASAHILQGLPDPERIRDRLAHLFAEANLLRSLLRVAERVAGRKRDQKGRKRQEGDGWRA
jgi:hypothetical protein